MVTERGTEQQRAQWAWRIRVSAGELPTAGLDPEDYRTLEDLGAFVKLGGSQVVPLFE
jgi:hypothetical protein